MAMKKRKLESNRNYYLRNKEKVKEIRAASRKRNGKNAREYAWKRAGINMTVERYDELFISQNGVCDICKNPPTTMRLAVDHIHDETGRVRGLLCKKCNQLLEALREDPDYIKSFLLYLNKHSC